MPPFNRKVLVSLWTGVVLGLFTVFGPPLTLFTGLLLLCMAIAPPTVALMLWRVPSLTLAESIAEVLHPVDTPRTERLARDGEARL